MRKEILPLEFNWDNWKDGQPYYEVERNDFHVGQIYDDYAAKTTICKKCGADKFMVGQGSYFTAIKCTNCNWEICIHDG